MFAIAPSARLRPSPFFDATKAEGVCAMTVYNGMLMPTSYGDPEAEYWRLIEGVSMWDVACERQIQLQGVDAARLAQILVSRDISRCKVGQGKYVALCNHQGTIINDPILLKRSADCYWLSIADSNIGFWASAIARERGLTVEVSEPDISPLAVQGPKAEAVMTDLFGSWIRDIKFFGFRETRLEGVPLVLARSGWSKQGGFEIYLMDGQRGTDLWNMVKAAGQPYGIGPGNPNACERIESGLLSWGGDTDAYTNPFEVRMEPYVSLDLSDETIGLSALQHIVRQGVRRHQLGVILDGKNPMKLPFIWYDIEKAGKKIGDMTNCVWSYRLKANIGFALVDRTFKAGDEVLVKKDGRKIAARLSPLPFI